MASRLVFKSLSTAKLSCRPPASCITRSYVSLGPKRVASASKPPPSPISNNPATPRAANASTASEIEAELAAAVAQANHATEVTASTPPASALQAGSDGLDVPLNGNGLDTGTDWSKSYHGLSSQPFPKEVAEVLLGPINPEDVEMKPDGLIYLPEIKYRRILNKAFGPGGWGLAPRSETNVGPKVVSREYALVCLGRLVAIARGEQEYFDPSGIPTATEACKSNALMRCCKDLGIASELWDPRFIREFKAKYCMEVFAEHLATKKKKKLWRRKDQPKFEYPYKE